MMPSLIGIGSDFPGDFEHFPAMSDAARFQHKKDDERAAKQYWIDGAGDIHRFDKGEKVWENLQERGPYSGNGCLLQDTNEGHAEEGRPRGNRRRQ